MGTGINYYDKFSKVYDIFSPDIYYRKARKYAINQLELGSSDTLLNIPCGTGQNFKYLSEKVGAKGKIIGIDLSSGMLEIARQKIKQNAWNNISLFLEDAQLVDKNWIKENIDANKLITHILCDLGLSGFPDWEKIIDNFIDILPPGGKLVVMDWYIPKNTLRARFIRWIGKGEVDRPIYQYMSTKLEGFQLDSSFNRNGVFVASGVKSLIES